MKPSALEFLPEIEKINISEIISEIENKLWEINIDNGASFSFGSTDNIVSTIETMLYNADFFTIDTITDFGFYYCGVLTAEPWGELGKEEESILNLILKDFIRVESNNDGIFLAFHNNSKSSLYRFFYKNRDGYGGNIAYSINIMLAKLVKWIKKELNTNADNYGSWEYEIRKQCPECNEIYYSYDDNEYKECPECKVELNYL